MDTVEITEVIVREIREILDDRDLEISGTSELIGEAALLKSRDLVSLLLALEEFAESELQTTFDWASDSAMSSKRSVFRTVASLASHLHSLKRR